ncbi:hypothetical protein OIU84_023902, partial [Salix udensis]
MHACTRFRVRLVTFAVDTERCSFAMQVFVDDFFMPDKVFLTGSNGKAEPYQKLASLQIDRRPPEEPSKIPKTFNETLVDKYSPNPSLSSSRGYGFPRLITSSLYITTTSILFKGLRRRRIFLKQPTEDNDALSEALKAADKAESLLESLHLLLERASHSRRQRRNSKVKRVLLKELHQIRKCKGEKTSRVGNVRRRGNQKGWCYVLLNIEFCISQSKTITVQEICVETLYQKLQLMRIHAGFDSITVGLSLVH